MRVIVYSTPICPWCQAVKSFLRTNKIEFEEIDVSRDEAKAQEMILKSGQTGVPVIEIDGKIVKGFDKPLLEEILGISSDENNKQ